MAECGGMEGGGRRCTITAGVRGPKTSNLLYVQRVLYSLNTYNASWFEHKKLATFQSYNIYVTFSEAKTLQCQPGKKSDSLQKQ